MRATSFITTLPVLATLLVGCARPERLAGPPAEPNASRAAERDSVRTRRALEHAADGLLYTSESDYPFTYFYHAGPAPTPLTVESFRAVVGIPADSAVAMISLDDFFARHIERVDPYDPVAVALVPRYQALKDTIERVLREPRVFRVGQIAITCYVVGTDRWGNVVGLTTVSIET